MGKANNVINNYLSDKRRFADLINALVYRGEQIIDPSKLRRISADTYEDLEDKNPSDLPKRKARYNDLAMRYDNNLVLRIFLEENQDAVSYILPVRDLGYNAARYRQQCQQIKKAHDKANDYADHAERCSGLRKEDKLIPVYTLWLYHGEKTWDGPRSLKDMINFGNDEDGFSKLFHDHTPHLVCVNELNEFNLFKTELSKLMEAISLKSGKAGIKGIRENERFRHVDEETLEAMSVLLNEPSLWKNRDKIKNEGRDYDVCTGMREWREEIIEETTELVETQNTIEHAQNLINNEGFSIERALSALGVPEEKRSYYSEKLKEASAG